MHSNVILQRCITVLVAVLLVGGSVAVPAVSAASASPDVPTTSGDNTASIESGSNQTVIVRLTEQPARAIQTTAKENRSDVMKAHAADTRAELERFAERTPHVEIDQTFWLINAVAVTVDTERVSLKRLERIDNVEATHDDYTVNTADGMAPTPAASATESSLTATSQPSGMPTETPRTAVDPFISTTTNTHTTLETTYSTVAPATRRTNFTRALEIINVPSAWNRYEHRGDGVRVAVLDTGVNPDHPDIEISEDDWMCSTECLTPGPHDVNGHGTHVSGTIVGGNHNEAGLQIGVAPNATLMHAKVLDDRGAGSFTSVLDGMQWAISNNADVISMSFTAQEKDSVFIEAVRNAHASGTVVVAATGNGGANTSGTPGNIYDVVSVGSVNVDPAFGKSFDLRDDTVSAFSGGERVNTSVWASPPAEWPDSYVVPAVTAPGSVIWSADANLRTATNCGGVASPTTDLACQQGTSMAVPHVAGTIALMLSNSNVERSPDEIRTTLETTAVDLNTAKTRQGAGRINTSAAVGAVTTQSNFTVDLTIPSSVPVGEQLTVSYRIKNTGTEAGTSSIRFNINDSNIDTRDGIILAPGETSNGTFTYLTTEADIGLLNVTVETDDNVATQTISVVVPSETIPSDLPEAITPAVYNAINPDGGDLKPSEIAIAINKNSENGNVDGVLVKPSQFALLINWNADRA